MCPMKDKIECAYFKELPSKGISSNNVFYVFDSKTHKEDRLLKKYLENWLSNLDLNLVDYDTTTGASKMAFCENICRRIIESPFIIADVTDYTDDEEKHLINPNVMLEIGLAMGLQKDLLLITRKSLKKKLPFDIAGFTVYEIHNEPEKVQEAINILNQKNPSYPLFKIISGTGITISELFLKTENSSLIRKYVQNYFISMTRSEEISNKIAKDLYTKKKEQEQYFRIAQDRKQSFISHINSGKELYLLYHKKELEFKIRKNQTAFEYKVNIEELIRQIDEHIQIIEYPNVNIGLTDQPLPYLFSIFGDNIILVENEIEGRYEGQQHICGMIHTSNIAVEEFLIEFERLWGKSETEKAEIVKWLGNIKSEL